MSPTTSQPPVVTAIIPTYRRPYLLKRALQSVLTQTYPYLKACVYDCASGDETAAVVRELAEKDPRVYYHCHSEDIGIYNNLLYALERVDTPFFSFLGDDDWLLPNFYYSAIKDFEKFPRSKLAFSGFFISRSENAFHRPLLKAKSVGYYEPPEGFMTLLQDSGLITTASVLFRTEVVEEGGGPLNINCPAIDLEWLLRLTSRFPMVVSSSAGAVFRDHVTSLTSRSELSAYWPSYLEVIDRVLNYPDVPMQYKAVAKQKLLNRLKNRLIYCCLSSMARGDWREALAALEPVHNFLGAVKTAAGLRLFVNVFKKHPQLVEKMVYFLIKEKRLITNALTRISG